MESLINHLKNNWEVLKQAPGVFIISCLLIAALVYYAVDLFYKERIETLKERLTAKDEQLNEYRRKGSSSQASVTSFARLSNLELIQKSSQIFGQVRQLLSSYHQSEINNRQAYDNLRLTANTEVEKNKLWNDYGSQSSRISAELMQQYDSKFKTDAILLRDEILSRLPKVTREDHVNSMYDHPTNPIGIEMVVSDLEKLTKSLPTN